MFCSDHDDLPRTSNIGHADRLSPTSSTRAGNERTEHQNNKEGRVIYMKTYTQFWSHLAHLFLEWDMFQTKDVHILWSINFL